MASRPLTSVGSFSGGNQQKIALAKWLFAESRILLLFDPTRGIDVGTKHELYVLMRAFAELGVTVLYAGRIVAEIGADDLSEHNIMRAALGAETPGTEAVA